MIERFLLWVEQTLSARKSVLWQVQVRGVNKEFEVAQRSFTRQARFEVFAWGTEVVGHARFEVQGWTVFKKGDAGFVKVAGKRGDCDLTPLVLA